MRLQLTVADPSTAVIEYQVEAAPENTVGELAEALAARRPEPTGTPPAIFVAGATYQLDLGEHTIGTASVSRVGLTDPSLAPVMASVRVLPDGRCRLRPEQPGLLLDRVELDGEQAW
ncbi:hypothetical protein, partial [Micromonospora gifhornensis]